MRKITLLLLALAIFMSITGIFAQIPKPILQELYDVGGSYPDNIVYPEDGTITYQVWILSRPNDVQSGPTGIMSAGMDEGKFLLQFNMGNFSFPWTAGDMMRVEVQQTTTGRIASVEFPVAAGTSPQARFDGNSMVLQEPPLVLFDSRPTTLDPIMTTANLMAGYPQNGVYRANNWVAVGTADVANSNWHISFSTVGIDSDLMVTSKIRRANYFDEDEHFEDIQGPRSFRTYYSIDNGATWVQHPSINHLLPITGEDWLTVEFELPEACLGQENVLVQWRLLAAGGSTIVAFPFESWGEIKDVVVTGEGELEVNYTLTIEVEGEGETVPAAGEYQYLANSEVVIEAIAADGWQFDKWVIGGVEIMDVETTVIMDGDIVAVAHFVLSADPNPTAAHSPIPADEQPGVALDTIIGWTYTSDPLFTDPIGYKINMWTGSIDGEHFQTYVAGGPGEYTFPSHPFDFQYATTYFWQVIPTTEGPEGRSASSARTRNAQRQTANRGDAINTPIWSFTTMDEPMDNTETEDMVFDPVDGTYTGEVDLDGDGLPDVVVTFTPADPLAPPVQMEITYSTNPHYPSIQNFSNPNALGAYFGFNLADPNDFAIFENGVISLQFPNMPGQIWFNSQGAGWQQIDWTDITGPGAPDYTYVIQLGNILAGRDGFRNGSLEFAGDNGVDTLPVSLSSFTANVTSNMFVELQWVAETETNMLGYHVYRGSITNMSDARQVTAQPIPAANSSEARTYIFVDEDVLSGNTYYYWLQTIDLDLTNSFHGPVAVTLEEEQDVPDPLFVTALSQNYPNPFNPETTIKYSLREDTEMVELKIYNVLGQLVKTLHSGPQNKGEHTVVWDGKDNSSRNVTSGVYFYKMSTPTYNNIYKMMLLK